MNQVRKARVDEVKKMLETIDLDTYLNQAINTIADRLSPELYENLEGIQCLT